MINPAYHQFLIDENRSMRDLLRKLYKERQWLESELLDLRGLLQFYEQQEARSLKVSGALAHKSTTTNTH
jgi:hypothetical protein